jgi:malate dehydrogenase (oxaloacetate-decarboxylating)
VERLRNELQIPVFHDDQHGTAVITLAALINALRLLHKEIDNIRVVVAGAGSAGYGIFRILQEAGCKNIVVTDSIGAIYGNRVKGIDSQYKKEIADSTNPLELNGSLGDVLRGADVFIGVSGKSNLLDKKMIVTMNKDPIVFALSNPDPEIFPSDAIEAGARIVATGRSDFANQINNAVVFPAILRALLDLRVKNLDEGMLVSVATVIADMIDSTQLKYDYIIPKVNDPRLVRIVTDTLKDAIAKHIEKKKQEK